MNEHERVDPDEVAKALGARRIGVGTTTLDMLYHNYPWLKTMIEAKDAEIAQIAADYQSIGQELGEALDEQDKEIAKLKRMVENLGGRYE